MKKLQNLTNEDYQDVLSNINENLTFNKIIFDINNIYNNGIEYFDKNGEINLMPFHDIDLIMTLYKKNIDLTIPFQYLKYDYKELDDENFILFEYVMELNRKMKMIK